MMCLKHCTAKVAAPSDMPLSLMTGRSPGPLRRACRGDAAIGPAPKGRQQEQQGETVLSPHPNLSSGVAQSSMVSDVVEVARSSLTSKAKVLSHNCGFPLHGTVVRSRTLCYQCIVSCVFWKLLYLICPN